LKENHNIEIQLVLFLLEENTIPLQMRYFSTQRFQTLIKTIAKLKLNLLKHTNGNSRKAGRCHNSVVLANKKSNNWGETRPEWGLKNAGFIVCREN
jgi:uncharacterized protein YbcC (UPF0753/DUF2309 family)